MRKEMNLEEATLQYISYIYSIINEYAMSYKSFEQLIQINHAYEILDKELNDNCKKERFDKYYEEILSELGMGHSAIISMNESKHKLNKKYVSIEFEYGDISFTHNPPPINRYKFIITNSFIPFRNSQWTIKYDSESAPNHINKSLTFVINATIIVYLVIHLKLHFPEKYEGMNLNEIISKSR